jgi:REP element-mobilizing transposase RayT
MILGAHVIISAYGFWLPNDPRGSWTEFVAAWELLRFGKATKVSTRQSVAHVSHDRAARLEAKKSLKFPPVLFTGEQAVAIGAGFARAVREGDYRIHACSILPDHVHFVAAAHARSYEQMTAHMKAHATRTLAARGLHPLGNERRKDGTTPSPWAESLWKVPESHQMSISFGTTSTPWQRSAVLPLMTHKLLGPHRTPIAARIRARICSSVERMHCL